MTGMTAEEPMGIRTAVTSLYDLLVLGRCLQEDWKNLRKVADYLHLSLRYPSWSRKPRVPMNVKKLVERWHEVILILTTAHDKDALDAAEYTVDELLSPLLTVPVKQLREFYHALTQALEADKRIPFFAWAMFGAWGELHVKDAPDEGVIELKERLAREIAQAVEKDVQPQLVEALTNALKWRGPEALEQIKEEVGKGKRGRLQGSQSCLFLRVGDATVML